MKTLRNKMATITLVMMLASVMLMVYTPVSAQQELEVATQAYLSFRPNPVGVGQTVLVNIWIRPPTHVSRYLSDYTVTITDPDGKKEVVKKDSYYGDASSWFEFVPNKVGTWKLKFEFPGKHFPEGDVPGGFGEPAVVHLLACYYKPSSTAEQELIVQEEPVLSWPPSPLPNDYWTRPISPEHREWWSIAGNYPWNSKGGEDYPGWPAETNAYASNYKFVPWVQAPNTAHVVWRRQTSIGGLIGGSMYHSSLGTMTLGGGTPGTIYSGRCYQSVTKPGGTSVLQCYDLRTGEVLWEVTPNPIPTVYLFGIFAMPGSLQISYEKPSPEVPGATARGGEDVSLVALGSRLIKINPWDGTVTMNVTGMSGTLYNDPYVLSVQNIGTFWAPNYRLINWTIERNAGPVVYTAGGMQPITTNFADRVRNNVSWPLGAYWSVVYDYEAGIAAAVNNISPPATGAWTGGTNIVAASLKTGELLWNKTIPDNCHSPATAVADHGKVAFACMDRYWVALNLKDGSLAWKSELADYPWGCWWAYTVASAYGNLYGLAYDGVYAFDWDDGHIVWKYRAPTPYPYETPYSGNYSFMGSILIADGKVYAQNNEHTPTSPLTRGWRLHCINATTGEGIWTITGSMTPGAVADGYLVASNMYDGYMYVFGKGKSATTVSVSSSVITSGSTVLIEGTVTDQSPGQPGTPCVSKESMTEWMEYLHMQKPMPASVTGVPVLLEAYASNGSIIEIGWVTSDLAGFRCEWTPPYEEVYTIMATFMGDDSYGSSWAATNLLVGPAPPQPEMPEIPTPPDYTMIFAAIIALVIIAILIGVYSIYSIRKLRK